MENQPTIEELLNVVTLQEKALEYYSNKKNYSGDINKMPILKDRGEQARFVLEQSKKIRNFETDMVEKLKLALNDTEIFPLDDSNTEETMSRINTIRNIFDNINGNK